MSIVYSYLPPAALVAVFLYSIYLMQSPRTALRGNRLGALTMAVAVILTFHQYALFMNAAAWTALGVGGILGLLLAQRAGTLRMPQLVALFNGVGGAASALVILACLSAEMTWSNRLIASLALAIGSVTFSGSMAAALKLEGKLSSRPVSFLGYSQALRILFVVILVLIVIPVDRVGHVSLYILTALALIYGWFMALRVGGADMPVIISLLNSLSGVAACVSGIAMDNILTAGVGALVGVAGMILTQIMCRAMNRDLWAVLSGVTVYSTQKKDAATDEAVADDRGEESAQGLTQSDIPALLEKAETVIIVPGYGMALSQAQQVVKDLMDALEARGKDVRVAVHPVAGRMPGHMHVLLAEVGVDYEMLYDMVKINDRFAATDLVVAVGACDVMNPAAATAEGTPIFGMPILKVSEAKAVIVCNLDAKPGYSGVENTLYTQAHVVTLWGDASGTVADLKDQLEDLQ